MKKFLIAFGFLIVFIISSATLFKLMHWPGAGPLFVLGITFFSIFFIPMFFIMRMIENSKGLSITVNIMGMVSSSMIFMGVLFKLMHWPGAAPMIVFGSLIFSLPTMILYIVFQYKENERKFGEYWRLVVTVVLVSVFLIFWGGNVSKNILYSFLKAEDATLNTNRELKEINSFLIASQESKSDSNALALEVIKTIDKQTKEMNLFVEDVKNQLIEVVEQNPDAKQNHWLINQKDNYDVPSHILCSGSRGLGQELLEKLIAHKKRLKEQLNRLPLENKEETIESYADFGINTEANYSEMTDGLDSWTDAMFYQQTIVGSLSLLSSIQNEVLNAEFKCLKVISTVTK